MSTSTVYLVTGANRARGIGFGLVSRILETHNGAFVYATARDPENAVSLQELKGKYPGRISVVKYLAGDVASSASVAKKIEEGHGRLDTVIACAASAGDMKRVDCVDAEGMEETFHINVMGPIVLFQSVLELLKKSPNPRFVPIGSVGGMIGTGIITSPIGFVSYGVSKAALNWATRKIHFENEWLTAFPLCPGGVATDTVVEIVAKDDSGLFKNFVTGKEPTTAEAAIPLLKIIDESTREKDGGLFARIQGDKVPAW